MNFAARRYALETIRRGLAGKLPGAKRQLVGARPLSWQLEQPARPSDEIRGNSSADELYQIEAALARLREGSYGFCQICGDDIDDACLDANPATPFCGSCDR